MSNNPNNTNNPTSTNNPANASNNAEETKAAATSVTHSQFDRTYLTATDDIVAGQGASQGPPSTSGQMGPAAGGPPLNPGGHSEISFDHPPSLAKTHGVPGSSGRGGSDLPNPRRQPKSAPPTTHTQQEQERSRTSGLHPSQAPSQLSPSGQGGPDYIQYQRVNQVLTSLENHMSRTASMMDRMLQAIAALTLDIRARLPLPGEGLARAQNQSAEMRDTQTNAALDGQNAQVIQRQSIPQAQVDSEEEPSQIANTVSNYPVIGGPIQQFQSSQSDPPSSIPRLSGDEEQKVEQHSATSLQMPPVESALASPDRLSNAGQLSSQVAGSLNPGADKTDEEATTSPAQPQ